MPDAVTRMQCSVGAAEGPCALKSNARRGVNAEAEPRAPGLIVGKRDFPERRFRVAIIDRNMTDGSADVVREWRA